MNRSILLALVLPALCSAPLAAQDDAAAELEAAGRNIMSDPRLRNVLRSVKQDPDGAIDTIRQDPEEAVREAARKFQIDTDGIDAEKLKAAAAQAQRDGTLDRAVEKATEVVSKATAATEAETPAVPSAMVQETGNAVEAPASPDATPAPEVPATRPAPGIVGGAPTPVAMPVEPGAPAIPDASVPATPAPGRNADSVVQPIAARPIANTVPTVPELPNLDISDVPAPVPLSKKYPQGAPGGHRTAGPQHMEVLSKEAIMDNTKGILLFTGDVFVDSPDYEMKCEKLEIHLADGVGQDGSDTDSSFKRAIASGGMVEIKRFVLDEKGKKKTQIALGRRADYNAITQEFVLSGGPPYIQDGDRFVRTSSEDAKIIMRGNGLYEITGSTNRNHIVIPVENKNGDGKKKGGVGMPGGLDTAFDRLR